MGLWGAPVAGGTLVEGSNPTLATTSTSTLMLASGSFLPTCWLRTYGLIDESVAGTARSAGLSSAFETEGSESFDPTAACPGTYDAAAHQKTWISYVDSQTAVCSARIAYTDADFPLEFAPTVPLASETTEALVQWTCVPQFKAPTAAWPYSRRIYDTASCTYTTAEYYANFWALYKDVSVVKIPSTAGAIGPLVIGAGPGGGDEDQGNGYLMITVRQRILADEATAPRADGSIVSVDDPFPAFNVGFDPSGNFGLGGPGTCFADIVCWYSDDPEFRTNVKGPYLLVHSNYALDTQPSARLWLGVPGATWHRVGGEWWLYVYYQCEPHDPGDPAMRAAVASYGLSESLNPCTGTLSEASVGIPAEVDAPGQELYADVESGIAVKRFRFGDVLAEIVGAAAVPEDGWSIYSGTLGWMGTVTGEALGYIRVWMTGGPVPAGTVQEWGEFVMAQTGAATPLHKADPAPLHCPGRLALFFAANQYDPFSGIANPPFQWATGGPWSGYGIWRCVAAAEGLALDTDGDGVADLTTGPYGKDFFCDANADTLTGTELCLGQVAHSRIATEMFIDPDPVRLPDGSARVFFGAGNAEYDFVSGPPGVPCRNDATAAAAAAAAAAALVVIGRGPGEVEPPDVVGAMLLERMVAQIEVGKRP